MFPISIWIPQEYPAAPPMGFVTPTKSMAVRPGQHVTGEGRIYHPYLAEWREDVSNFLSAESAYIARSSSSSEAIGECYYKASHWNSLSY